MPRTFRLGHIFSATRGAKYTSKSTQNKLKKCKITQKKSIQCSAWTDQIQAVCNQPNLERRQSLSIQTIPNINLKIKTRSELDVDVDRVLALQGITASESVLLFYPQINSLYGLKIFLFVYHFFFFFACYLSYRLCFGCL